MRTYALILGVSSGFGRASAIELARGGLNIFGVHLDRKSGLEEVEKIKNTIESLGVMACFFNVNAADAEKRGYVVSEIQRLAGSEDKSSTLKVFLHSLAFGTLKPLISKEPTKVVSKTQLEMTLDVMANSMVYWVQDLFNAGLLKQGCQVYAMTSAGGSKVWPTYGPVSAAKSALESYVRQLAYELAPHSISVNAILAGVTKTPALEKIPSAKEMLKTALERSQSNRLTTPEDIAHFIATLALSPIDNPWLTGNIINVDGGENLST